MATKYDVYKILFQFGIDNDYIVLPEFRITNTPVQGKFRDIDIVWARERKLGLVDKEMGNLRKYEIIAAFEIEGFDVNKKVGKSEIFRFDEHFENYEQLLLQPSGNESLKFALTVLYEDALDRGEWGKYKRPNTKSNNIKKGINSFVQRRNIKNYSGRPYYICCGKKLERTINGLIIKHLRP